MSLGEEVQSTSMGLAAVETDSRYMMAFAQATLGRLGQTYEALATASAESERAQRTAAGAMVNATSSADVAATINVNLAVDCTQLKIHAENAAGAFVKVSEELAAVRGLIQELQTRCGNVSHYAGLAGLESESGMGLAARIIGSSPP